MVAVTHGRDALEVTRAVLQEDISMSKASAVRVDSERSAVLIALYLAVTSAAGVQSAFSGDGPVGNGCTLTLSFEDSWSLSVHWQRSDISSSPDPVATMLDGALTGSNR